MESLPVSKFKATCHSVLSDVKALKKQIIITKHGEPIAKVIPYSRDDKDIPLKDTVTFMSDIISPVTEKDWECPS